MLAETITTARRLGLAIGVSILLAFSVGAPHAAAQTGGGNPCAGQTKILDIVAHEDDDLLFINPAVQQDIRHGDCLRTVFLTAGDAGRGRSYWEKREAGIYAAYSHMSGTSNNWNRVRLSENGRTIIKDQLVSNPKISVMFMRLPDGGIPGDGYASTNHTSLRKLWQGRIPGLKAVDGSAHYTKNALTATLASIITDYHPTAINTLNFNGSFGDGDHTDHVATAYFAKAAVAATGTAYTLTPYLGYPMKHKPVNLSATDTQRKQNTFFVYDRVVGGVCQTTRHCGWEYGSWLPRQYVSQ